MYQKEVFIRVYPSEVYVVAHFVYFHVHGAPDGAWTLWKRDLLQRSLAERNIECTGCECQHMGGNKRSS